MSTLTLQNKDTTPNLDGPNDLKPVVVTSYMQKQKDIAAAAEAAKKKEAAKSE